MTTTVNCPSSGTLRAHLAEPDHLVDAHLDACATCRGLATSVAASAGIVAGALRHLDGEAECTVDVDAALRALERRGVAASGERLPVRNRRWTRPLATAAAVVAAVALIVLSPAGRDAVAQLLDAFRVEQIQVVTLDLEDPFAALEDLAFASVDTTGLGEPTQAGEVVRMPAGVLTITLGDSEQVDVPAQLEGAVLRVLVPEATIEVHGDPSAPELVIGRAGALHIQAEGAPLEDIRAFLLSRPELPASLRSQLAAIPDWRHTLPIPVVEGTSWREVEIAGRPGLAFGDDTGLGAVVLRLDGDGSIVAVAGPRPVSELLELAEGL